MIIREMSFGAAIACVTTVLAVLAVPAVGDVFYDTTNGLDQTVLASAPGLSNFGSDPDPHDVMFGQTVSFDMSYALESISVGLKATADPGPIRLHIFDVGTSNTPAADAVAAYTEDIDTSGLTWNGFRQYYTFSLANAFTMSASTNYTIAFSSGSPAGTLKWYTSDQSASEWVKGAYSLDGGATYSVSNATYSMQLAGSAVPVPGVAALAPFGGLVLIGRRRRR